MNILIPAGFVGTLTIQSHPLFVVNDGQPDADPSPAPSAPELNLGKPFTQAGRNNIYLASYGVAVHLTALRPGEVSPEVALSELIDFTQAIYDSALLLASAPNPPTAEDIAEGLHKISSWVKTTKAAPVDSSTTGELEWIRRSLAIQTMKKAKPVVTVTEETALIELPEGGKWVKPLREFTKPAVLFHVVRLLGEKRWANAEILGRLVEGVCALKGWEIYDFDAKLHQGEG